MILYYYYIIIMVKNNLTELKNFFLNQEFTPIEENLAEYFDSQNVYTATVSKELSDTLKIFEEDPNLIEEWGEDFLRDLKEFLLYLDVIEGSNRGRTKEEEIKLKKSVKKMHNNIKKAIDWWVEQITKGTKQDMGENSVIHKTLEWILSDNKQEKNKNIWDTDIKSHFENLIWKKFMINQRDIVSLNTDYEPEWILEDIVNEYNLDPNLFPVKTTMWIEKNGDVKVRLGAWWEVETL